ncbi:TRAP transporter solute binding subunit DctP [Oleiphilus messinensis]|uniref:TRAP transporter solute binding subunit DctP n=1 Tax=Oleiphilus messinensis TaxID=141451 RepID=A0A1Y0IFI3_9GAMM|nr:putative solute-binding protein [Oleiphilus messinensis]ARU59241.1 TRAP transporter solute binding subunit DctP [Oleiphilus messinensis]
MKKINTIINLFGAATLATSSVNADVLERKFCIFDPVGANGPMFNVMKSSKPSALKWGVNLELAAYTDEKIAAEDLKAGQCDAALLTSTRAREFNRFTGSLEALGAITSDEEMKMVLETLNQSKAAKLLTSGKYEVAGILPAGAVYLFLRDRTVNSVEKLQGKKIATLDYDHASLTMVRHVGASVVGATSSSFAGKFNNGSVDAAYAPAIAYTPLELYKGIGTSGGVFDYKLAQFTFQIIIQKDKFPEDFGQNARDYTASIYDEAHKMVSNAEAEINPQHWMRPTRDEVAGYDNLLREVRISLKEEGVYDPKALRLMLKVRCKTNPDKAECVEGRE